MSNLLAYPGEKQDIKITENVEEQGANREKRLASYRTSRM